MKRLIMLFLLIPVACGLKVQAQAKYRQIKESKPAWVSYQNPIISEYLADPYIRFEKGFYYFFATGKAKDSRFIPIYRSKDLANWEFVRGAVENGSKTDWNYKHFWAPEVIKIKNKFYLYYTASPEHSPANSGNRVGVAIADQIEGPYQNSGVIIPNGSIDGHPVIDKDGSMYIFYTIEWQNSKGFKAGQIYVDKMISPVQAADNPQPVITHHNWQEGPFILKRNNSYFLTYSCGAWSDSTYHIRYARSNSICGPYIELPDTILKSNSMVKGPGHHSVFQDKTGKDWIVYHGWDTAHTARYPRIDLLKIEKGKIKCSGPTFSPQRVSYGYKTVTKTGFVK